MLHVTCGALFDRSRFPIFVITVSSEDMAFQAFGPSRSSTASLFFGVEVASQRKRDDTLPYRMATGHVR